jgi:hypothetical protein
MSTMGYLDRNPLHRMNRQERRALMRERGISWSAARAAARRRAQEEAAEREVTAKALLLTPAEARRTLAEWANRGGR